MYQNSQQLEFKYTTKQLDLEKEWKISQQPVKSW